MKDITASINKIAQELEVKASAITAGSKYTLKQLEEDNKQLANSIKKYEPKFWKWSRNTKELRQHLSGRLDQLDKDDFNILDMLEDKDKEKNLVWKLMIALDDWMKGFNHTKHRLFKSLKSVEKLLNSKIEYHMAGVTTVTEVKEKSSGDIIVTVEVEEGFGRVLSEDVLEEILYKTSSSHMGVDNGKKFFKIDAKIINDTTTQAVIKFYERVRR